MEIEIGEALKRSDLLFIDVRSPGEHAEASIPGSINIPLFDDYNRSRIGQVYHLEGEAKARRLALEIVAPQLPKLVESIACACGDKLPLLYCSRGGLRSMSLYQVLTLSGIRTLRLKKGYKAYRLHVNKRLAGYDLKSTLIVLHGLTGVGKTLLIKALAAKKIPVVDLEGLARHRGSVFGAVGCGTPRSQKDFDALLLQELDKHSLAPALVIEGEGRRIGNIYLPPFLSEAMAAGIQVLLKAPLEKRAERIVSTYISSPVCPQALEQIKGGLNSLRRRMGDAKVGQLLGLLDQEKYETVAQILCSDYYDHYYNDSRPEHSDFQAVIDATDLTEAAKKIMQISSSKVLQPEHAACYE